MDVNFLALFLICSFIRFLYYMNFANIHTLSLLYFEIEQMTFTCMNFSNSTNNFFYYLKVQSFT